MLDKVLFWVVLVWMIGMLVMAFIAVREVWKDSDRPDEIPDPPEPSPKDARTAGPGETGG